MVRSPHGRRRAAAALALAVTCYSHAFCANELVLLDFWSPSCGPCMQMKPTVRSLIEAGYPVREVDVSREPQMARQYGITGIPCFVMLANGHEVERFVGATDSSRLKQMFARAKQTIVRGQSVDVDPRQKAEPSSIPWPGVTDSAAQVPYSQPAAAQPEGLPVAGAISTGDTAQSVLESPATLLAASVRITVEDAKGRGFGTGTIIDTRSGEALVITCGHIFRDSQGQGTTTVELFEAQAGGVRAAEKLSGQVIHYDLERDVAFVSIRPTRPVTVAPVAPPRSPIAKGDRAASIGCSNGQDPTILATRITWLDRYKGPPNIEASGAPVEGRSGGGLFNSAGQLIGVCYAADYEGNEGLYAALESIHAELDRLGLREIYAKGEGASPMVAAPPVVRGQEPLTPVMPVPQPETDTSGATVAVNPAEPPTAAPLKLRSDEQAALDEIDARLAEEFEVVCIVRPKVAGGQSEVIALDKVSPDFVRALATRQRLAEPTTPLR